MSLAERGKALEELGKAMQRPESTLTELADLALAARLNIQFRLLSLEEPEPDSAGEKHGG